jgi:hypothetical protein
MGLAQPAAPRREAIVDESFLVLFFKKEPLTPGHLKVRKRFFLKKEAKTFFSFAVSVKCDRPLEIGPKYP